MTRSAEYRKESNFLNKKKGNCRLTLSHSNTSKTQGTVDHLQTS